MELFENRRKKFLRSLLLLFPVLFLVIACILFTAGVGRTSGKTLFAGTKRPGTDIKKLCCPHPCHDRGIP